MRSHGKHESEKILLQQTLNEGRNVDKLLTKTAETLINPQAARTYALLTMICRPTLVLRD